MPKLLRVTVYILCIIFHWFRWHQCWPTALKHLTEMRFQRNRGSVTVQFKKFSNPDISNSRSKVSECLAFYLEGENQVTELEHSLQIQPDADLMNSCRRHSRDVELHRWINKHNYCVIIYWLTVLCWRLPKTFLTAYSSVYADVWTFIHFPEFTVNTVLRDL